MTKDGFWMAQAIVQRSFRLASRRKSSLVPPPPVSLEGWSWYGDNGPVDDVLTSLPGSLWWATAMSQCVPHRGLTIGT